VDIADDVYSEFTDWFKAQRTADPELNVTAQMVIRAAEEQGQRCLDELLNLPSGCMSLREWMSVNLHADPNPFRDVRRVGGDHDRGFTSTLNREIRKRRRGED
jgi:hypothetical protein